MGSALLKTRRQRSKDDKLPTPVSPIEMANKTSDEDFIANYLKPKKNWTEWTHPKTESKYTIGLVRTDGLSKEKLHACFELIDETSGDDYRSSSFGWHPLAKKKEMQSPDLRYILVEDEQGDVKGFASMMPTFENAEPVVYCYEVHLKPDLHGTGLGRQLMNHLVDTAENIPSVAKVMLTCFKSNPRGLKFYSKMGFDTDEFTPRERKLRGGRVVTPDYVILSRRTAEGRLSGAKKV